MDHCPRDKRPPIAQRIARDVALSAYTTLELGGPARWFLSARDEHEIVQALRWARERALPVAIVGGGSNVVVADAGFEGLVLHVATRGLRFGDDGTLEAQAGEPWDALVAASVARGWAGLECLSGIPGLVGATPIQNVGAYGQEVAETIVALRVLELESLRVRELRNVDCGFAYRDSVFKRDPGRHVVLGVRYRLRPDGAPSVRYAELERALSARGERGAATLAKTRETVLALRRAKSMVLDPGDDNRRSAGSFFVNPVVEPALAQRVVEVALREGLVRDAAEVPRHPTAEGSVKLAAGWLIERAGLARGLRAGAVGLSSRHALALVHHGGGSSAELLAFAREVRARVEQRFGVRLLPEPVFVGFGEGFAL